MRLLVQIIFQFFHQLNLKKIIFFSHPLPFSQQPNDSNCFLIGWSTQISSNRIVTMSFVWQSWQCSATHRTTTSWRWTSWTSPGVAPSTHSPPTATARQWCRWPTLAPGSSSAAAADTALGDSDLWSKSSSSLLQLQHSHPPKKVQPPNLPEGNGLLRQVKGTSRRRRRRLPPWEQHQPRVRVLKHIAV